MMDEHKIFAAIMASAVYSKIEISPPGGIGALDPIGHYAMEFIEIYKKCREIAQRKSKFDFHEDGSATLLAAPLDE